MDRFAAKCTSFPLGLLTGYALETAVKYLLFPCLLVSAAFAADGPVLAPRMPVGFDLSLGWVMPDDRRFEGSIIGFYLYVVPEAAVDVGLLREEMYLVGRDNGGSVSVHGEYDAVRARYRFFNDDIQSARLLASAGYAQFTHNLTVGAFAFDLGVEYVPWKASNATAASEFAIQLRYRYCRFASVDVQGLNQPVDNAGGFIAGVAGEVRF